MLAEILSILNFVVAVPKNVLEIRKAWLDIQKIKLDMQKITERETLPTSAKGITIITPTSEELIEYNYKERELISAISVYLKASHKVPRNVRGLQ